MNNQGTEEYFYGSGEVSFQEVGANDVPTGRLLFVGNADSAKVTLKVTRKDKRESMSGQNNLVRSKVVQLDGTIEVVLSESQADNLALFLFGVVQDRDAVTAHVNGHHLTLAETGAAEVGFIYPLDHQKIDPDSVTVTDDGAADAPISDTKYEIDPVYGKIKVLANFAGTGPYTVTYDAAAAKVIQVFQHSDKAFLFRHEGVNIANDDDLPFLAEFFKVKLDPVADMALITNDFGSFTLSGTLVASAWKPTDDTFGRFGHYIPLN